MPFNYPISPSYKPLSVSNKAVSAVAVLEKLSWNGGVGGPLSLDFYLSQQNALQLKSLQQLALKTTTVKSLGFWIGDYDQETKQWYEQAHPDQLLTGVLDGKDSPSLNVDLNPVQSTGGNLYKVSLAVAPAANKQYALHFAHGSSKKVVKSWGLVVGTISSQTLSK